MHRGKAPRQRCFGIKFTIHKRIHIKEKTNDPWAHVKPLANVTNLPDENIYIVKKNLNQIHIPKLWEHIRRTFMKINMSKSVCLRTRWFYFIVIDKCLKLNRSHQLMISPWGKELWVGIGSPQLFLWWKVGVIHHSHSFNAITFENAVV